MKIQNPQALLIVGLAMAVVLAGCTSPNDNSDPSSSPGTTISGGVGTGAPNPSASPGLAIGPAPVNLRSAGDYVILARSGVSTTGTTAVTGDIGVSPAGSTMITGFGLVMDASNRYATSSLVTGKVYASDYAAPSPTQMNDAINDMETAYTDAAGRTNPTATELGDGNIGARTLQPGLYKWGTAVNVLSDVTLSGGANDVWIFQIAQTLNVAPGAKIVLTGGAQAKNVFWQVAGQTTLGSSSEFSGNVLCHTAIVMNTGAKITGRAMAQAAVTLDANVVKALA